MPKAQTFESITLWYARTIGTQEEPWLLRTLDGATYRASRVEFWGGVSTRLLTDEEREKLPDKPRGIIVAQFASAMAERIQ